MSEPPPPLPTRARRVFPWRGLILGFAWLASLAVAARAGAFLVENRTAILRKLGRLEPAGLLQTNLYAVGFQRIRIAEDGRYGALEALPGGVLWASRSGRLWYVDSSRVPRELGVRVPINVNEFESDPFNASTDEQDLFAVRDLLTQSTPRGVRLLASHTQWDAEKDCYFLRISEVELPLESLLTGGDQPWRTVFDTRPCVELGLSGGGRRVPTIGAGGRLATLSEHELLLTTGIFVSDAAITATPELMRDPAYPYGKTIAIDRRSGASRILTTGHRNPQGLAIGSDGRVWSTEHAARGGDELNLLREGGDYGYPNVSYGTAYGSMDWPIGAAPGRHEGYAKPVHAWVPSIGISQLVALEGRQFERWAGDLVVAGLAAQSLFRVRIDEGRAIYSEPIPIGHRIRDLIESASGELVLLAEDGYLVYLEPLDLEAEDPGLIPRERGQLVAGRCQGCHTFERDGNDGIGPNLHGIVGRRVASREGFRYSEALTARGGRWTEDALRQYIQDPAGFAQGTTMEFAITLSETELGNLLAYLRSLR